MLKLFSSKHCMKCKIVKNLMDNYNIQYVEVLDLSELTGKTFTSLPVMKDEHGIFMGYEDIIKYIQVRKGI